MRFDANLSILFPGMALAEQLAAAAQAGFDAVEMWWPFAGVHMVAALRTIFGDVRSASPTRRA